MMEWKKIERGLLFMVISILIVVIAILVFVDAEHCPEKEYIMNGYLTSVAVYEGEPGGYLLYIDNASLQDNGIVYLHHKEFYFTDSDVGISSYVDGFVSIRYVTNHCDMSVIKEIKDLN